VIRESRRLILVQISAVVTENLVFFVIYSKFAGVVFK